MVIVRFESCTTIKASAIPTDERRKNSGICHNFAYVMGLGGLMLTDDQMLRINLMVGNGVSLRDSIRSVSGLALDDKLRDWILAHPTAESDYLEAKKGLSA